MKKFLIPILLLSLCLFLMAQERHSNSGGIYFDSTVTVTDVSATRLLLPFTTVTADGTNAVCDLAAATNFRIYTGGTAVYLIFSNLTSGASGKVKVYGNGTPVTVSSAVTNSATGAALSVSCTNLTRVAYDMDGTAATNINCAATTY